MSVDPAGVQAERTELAWTRTTTSVIAAAAALIRLSFDRPVVVQVLAIGFGISAVGVIRISVLRAHHLRSTPEPGAPPALAVGATAASALLGAVAALGVVLTR